MEPKEVTDQYGADILRLWASSVDYQTDMRISPDILKQLSEAYRKIRNTARFILGNLGDFDPDLHSTQELEELDCWPLYRLNELLVECREAYQNYEFHTVYHALHNFCVVDMSNFYLDILKDRLYIERDDSKTRRAAQSTIYTILTTITLLVSPILAFTSEEIWKHLPRSKDYNYESVLFNEIPESIDVSFSDSEKAKWGKLLAIRDDAKKALELARNDKLIGASLEAKVAIGASGEYYDFYKSVEDILPKILITSEVEVKEDEALSGETISIEVTKASGQKCERCWSFSESVGQNSEHETLCARCASILG